MWHLDKGDNICVFMLDLVYPSNFEEGSALKGTNLLPAGTTLRKQAYSNILKILQTKSENVQIKMFDIFHIPVQNIDCGYSLEPPLQGGFNEYLQSTFFSKMRKIMYTAVNPGYTI